MFAFMNAAGRVATTVKHYLIFLVLGFGLVLQGCGGGGSGGGGDGGPTPPPPEKPDPVTPPSPLSVSGGGVKGPLGNAIVTAYLVDTTQAGFKGAVIDTAATDAKSALVGLELPVPLTPPYILEFTSDAGTTDITTGKAPIITTLRTVVTQSMLDSSIAIYASPQTTMATDIAIKKADSNTPPYKGNNDGTASTAEFLDALPTAAGQVMSTLGFGASTKVDIFTTAPLINSQTTTTEEQQAVAEYRTAIEALTAVVYELGASSTATPQTAEAMLAALTADLSDGIIDGKVDGVASTIIDTSVVDDLTVLNPTDLPIPGTTIKVGDVEQVLVDEKATTGETTGTPELEGGSIDVTPVPAVDKPSKDGDSIPDFIDNCPAAANEDQVDTNKNGVGDVCDEAPVATADGPYSVDEGTTLPVTAADGVLKNDTDTEGDKLTAVIGDLPTNGTLTLNSDGSFSYSHDGSETTSDSFTYKANDGTSDSNIVTVSITINPVNDAPEANADGPYTMDEGGTLIVDAAGGVLHNDSDAEDDVLTAIKVSDPTNGSVTLNPNGSFIYIHSGSETTTDSFTYKANDGSLDSNVVAVTITINPVNDAPVAMADGPYSVNEGQALIISDAATGVLNNDSDAEGDPLTAIKLSEPVNGSVTLNSNGTFTYNHDGSETTSDSFTYKANDGSLDSNVVTVSITVTPMDDPAILIDDAGSITEDAAPNTVSGNVLDNDSDVDSLLDVTNAASLSGTGAYGSLAIDATGAWTYTLDNTNPTVQSLNDGETLSETYNYDAAGQSAKLVITIHGVTDITPVNLSGVWNLTLTHVSETGPGCSGATVGTEQTLITSFTQSGTSLNAVEGGGTHMTGTIDETTGVFSLFGTETVEKADLVDITDPTPVVETVSTIAMTATGATDGTISSGDTVTITDNPGTDYECIATKTVSGQYLYTHTGSENYNGVYAFEILFTGYDLTGPFPSEREALTLEMVISGSDLQVHFAEYPGETNIVSATSFDPATGFFQFTLEGKSKTDDDGDGVIDRSSTSKNVMSGILVGDPTVFKGEDGSPIGPIIEKGYEHTFAGDVDVGGSVTRAFNILSHGYGRLLSTLSFSRTQLTRTGAQVNESQIKVGILNPPLRRTATTSKLYLQVSDSGTVLCTVPYSFDGAQKGQFVEQLVQPDPDMDMLNFRSTTYSRITCNTNDVDGSERVVDGSNYRVQVIDTGADGLLDGSGDSVVFDDPGFIASVAPASATLPEERRYTITPRVFDITVNGTSSSTTLGGDIIPLFGYFDTSEPLRISWLPLSGTDNYQLRLEETGNEMTEYRFSTSLTSRNIDISRLGEEVNLRLTAVNTIPTTTSSTAQAFSRKLNIAHGIHGLFDIELGGVTSLELETFQVKLSGNAQGMQYCEVMNNTAYSCNAVAGSIDFANDVVNLSFTDNNGSIAGTAGGTFTLQLHFKTTGEITSGSAVVTSPDDTAGIADTWELSNAHADRVNPELRVRSFKFSNGTVTSMVIMLNPIEEAVYQKALLKVNDDTPLIVGGIGTIPSTELWDDITSGKLFTDLVSTYVQYPTDDGMAQSTGRFVSARTDTGLGLGGGLLAADRYKLVLINPADVTDKQVFRRRYTALDPAAYQAPVLNDIVINPGSSQTICSSTTPACTKTSVVAVNPAEVFNLSWTVTTPPLDARWQMVLVEQSSGLKIRSRRLSPDAPDSEITSSPGPTADTTTYTWTVPADSFPAPASFEIQLRVSDSNQDIVGLSANPHKVYIAVTPAP